jgi:hypothetical protein
MPKISVARRLQFHAPWAIDAIPWPCLAMDNLHFLNSDCPASPEKEDQRAAGSPAASTQLALCLQLEIDLKGRKLATRRNPR